MTVHGWSHSVWMQTTRRGWRRYVFNGKLAPDRSGGPYWWAWRPRWSWWWLLPVAVQHWWVDRYNRRWCAEHGHEDFLWHLDEMCPGTPPIAAECTNCGAVLHACTDPEAHAAETAAPP